jgi:hypothetical protein
MFLLNTIINYLIYADYYLLTLEIDKHGRARAQIGLCVAPPVRQRDSEDRS